ncbi:hypothetical protein GGP57_001604 [Salinibacter ruber]|uniref:GIY-YIG nuclease family protein n=1 Tax=Salinibacter ruber TaxID=146919 RepID=UPI002166C2E7|nr:GIY-YIG nuclease family protein [Salinibacter ruber]MCS3634283.1 hypothetical protein [Salinibacter ruber]MCS3713773.1 hypothetical protein [Salinibacter ruber]
MEDSRPKTVQIYLPDGNARSIRVAEITSRTIQAVQIPRQKLEVAGQRDEVRRVGVYFLFGDDDNDASKPPAYIGEAENCLQRITGHHRRKDFWTTAVTITSKTRSFTKAHARRLEYDCIRTAQEAERFRLKNTQMPAEPHIPETMLAELRDNFGTIQTLLSMLGYPILDPIPKEEDTDDGGTKLYCEGNGAEATGEYTEDGLVVFEGSIARLETQPSASETIERRRENLRDDGVLEQEGDHLVFRENHVFNSPSAAVGVVMGRNGNGWYGWKDKDGQNLHELERQ